MSKPQGFCHDLKPPGPPPGGRGKGYRNPFASGMVPEFLLFFVVFGRFPVVSGRFSYLSWPVLESVFL